MFVKENPDRIKKQNTVNDNEMFFYTLLQKWKREKFISKAQKWIYIQLIKTRQARDT